jgi:hypothetical protein
LLVPSLIVHAVIIEIVHFLRWTLQVSWEGRWLFILSRIILLRIIFLSILLIRAISIWVFNNLIILSSRRTRNIELVATQ